MADLSYYAAKITECVRLLEGSDDPLHREVYQAMADEFAEKYEALKRRMLEGSAQAVPASPLLMPQVPPPPESAPSAAPAPGASRRQGDAPGLAMTQADPPDRALPTA